MRRLRQAAGSTAGGGADTRGPQVVYGAAPRCAVGGGQRVPGPGCAVQNSFFFVANRRTAYFLDSHRTERKQRKKSKKKMEKETMIAMLKEIGSEREPAFHLPSVLFILHLLLLLVVQWCWQLGQLPKRELEKKKKKRRREKRSAADSGGGRAPGWCKWREGAAAACIMAHWCRAAPRPAAAHAARPSAVISPSPSSPRENSKKNKKKEREREKE